MEAIGLSNQTTYGGLYFALENASGTQYDALESALLGSLSLQDGANNVFYYDEFASGTGTLEGTSTTGQPTNCGTFSVPGGYYSAVRCKFSPSIYSIQSSVSTGLPGLTVASGSTITISGVGFGQTRCSTCQVVAYPASSPAVTLAISSWSDATINALLPSFNEFASIIVQTVSGEDSINIIAAPAPSSLTIQTIPSGLKFSLDGGSLQTAPQTLSLVTGSTHTIAVATPQSGAAGTQYVFTGWSDGVGTASRSFTVSASGTLTASFLTQYQLTLSTSPSTGGTVTPASGSFYNSGAVVPITATANTGYSFSGWTGTVANASAASTTVTMSGALAVIANFRTASTPPINTPTINTGGVVPLDSSTPVIQPGSWISIFGSNLANTTAVWNNDYPISLGGVSVMINNKAGYLWYVSPGQINLQAPGDAATGLVSVVVATPNGTATSTVTLAQFGPAFSLFGNRYAAGVIPTPNGSGAYGVGIYAYDLLGPVGYFSFNTRPVNVGEILELYGVGFGPTNPPVLAGSAFTGSAPTAQTATVTIGGVPANVLYSGLTSAGLYQLNVVVPNLGSGDQLLQASVGGVLTPGGVYITVR